MNFDAQMRLGTLEMTAALLLVAVAAARPRVRASAEIGRHQPMRVALDFQDGNRLRQYEGRPPFEAGRGHELALSLRDPEVSRRHVRFESRDGVVYVDDLKSRNGTFLNGRRVSEAIEVRAGDTLDIGTTRMFVTMVQPWT